MLPLIEY